MKENLTKEIKLIDDRIKEIIDTSRDRYNKGERNTKTVDGKIIMADLEAEYNSLIKMKEIINNSFHEEHDFAYFEERKKTKLDPITPEEYGRIKGEALSGPRTKTKTKSSPSPKPSTPKPGTPKPAPKPEPKPAPKPTPTPEAPVKHKITKKEIFRWVGEHKKQILIAVGLTALSVATIVAIANLIPAIMAATQATQVAGLAGQMVANGQLWFTSTAAEQVALHGANTALASTISGLTGVANSFNAASGVWTIGTQTLPEFVAASNSLAASSMAKLGIIKGITAGTALGGLGALGAGLIPGHKKSEAYYKINKKIKLISKMIKDLDEAEYKQLIGNILAEINSSTELSSKEKAELLAKIQKILKKHNITIEPPKKEKPKKPEKAAEQEQPSKKKRK